jgi:hypothetical protein
MAITNKRAKKSKSKRAAYTSKDGNAFFACRVPRKLLRAFQAHAKRQKTQPGPLVVGFMATITGVEP